MPFMSTIIIHAITIKHFNYLLSYLIKWWLHFFAKMWPQQSKLFIKL